MPPTNLPNAPEDPAMMDAWSRMHLEEGLEGRKEAFADLQQLLYDDVYNIVMGDITKVQATRSNVKGFAPFRIPRLWNVWVEG
jgi:peptide/nickel transport system substrate-binding protein